MTLNKLTSDSRRTNRVSAQFDEKRRLNQQATSYCGNVGNLGLNWPGKAEKIKRDSSPSVFVDGGNFPRKLDVPSRGTLRIKLIFQKRRSSYCERVAQIGKAGRLVWPAGTKNWQSPYVKVNTRTATVAEREDSGKKILEVVESVRTVKVIRQRERCTSLTGSVLFHIADSMYKHAWTGYTIHRETLLLPKPSSAFHKVLFPIARQVNVVLLK